MVKKNFEDVYNLLDRIPACRGQTDGRTYGQTSCHGIVRAMHTRRAVEIGVFPLVGLSCFISKTVQDTATVTT